MIYDGENLLMNLSDGYEIRRILKGGFVTINEDDVRNHFTLYGLALEKALFIDIAYNLVNNRQPIDTLVTHYDDLREFVQESREAMISLYIKDFSDPVYRRYIINNFADEIDFDLDDLDLDWEDF
ncbi:hypothetical protein GIY09_09370 [Aerococcaceae bacterium WS4759]|uniref:Uncharacterized protein n=1 Tax=Fundicoccus ignavus TaxID=2664442 RepID=A0A6I2GKL8_9LACT|nr:hypothetical protein [Fundicoccus ignavus]MRI86071.1 hypothetical protein [Fundicoccus ignavus]